MLDATGAICAVAKPIEIAGQVVDLELVWLGERLRQVHGAQNYLGANFSDVYPDLYEEGWLEDLLIARATGKSSSRYRQAKRTVPGGFDAFEITGRWADGLVVFTITDMGVQDSSNADIVRAASLMADVLAANPMVFRVKLPNDTLEFATEAFQRFTGGQKRLKQLVVPEDYERAQQWFHTSGSRDPACTFRIATHDGGTRWLEARAQDIAKSDAQFIIVRDVDAYVRSERATAQFADKLHSQLDIFTRALDAAGDGFAIWRATRDDDGAVSTFTLEFMNSVGAAPTWKDPSELVGGTIEEIIGEEPSAGLLAMFARALKQGETLVDQLELVSEAGWEGTFETHVAPIGNDRVVASFRDVSGRA